MKRSIAAILVASIVIMWPGGFAMAADPTPATYTVQAGDTLLAIANTLGVVADQQPDWVDATVKLNSLTDGDHLAQGQVLNLPASTPSKVSALAAQAAAGADVSSGRTYTVQNGDTLLTVAGKLNIPAGQQPDWVDAVVKLNGLSDPNQLTLGQALNLPGTTAVATDNAAATPSTPPPSAPPPVAIAPPVLPVMPPPAAFVAAVLPPPPDPPSQAFAAPAGPVIPVGGVFSGPASPYSDSLASRPLGCQGAGPYNPMDVTVVAVSPAQYAQFPCGTRLELCGPVSCITGTRKDSCPACASYGVDLSRQGFNAVCGPAANSCTVRMMQIQ